MTIDTTWLKQICGDPVTRPSLSEPMTFERDGKQFTVATDGHRRRWENLLPFTSSVG